VTENLTVNSFSNIEANTNRTFTSPTILHHSCNDNDTGAMI